jgi:hypothetical protein
MRDGEFDRDGLSADERFGGRRRLRRAIIVAAVLVLTLAVFAALSLLI